MAPDLDIVLNASRAPRRVPLWHRGPTHALWFGPVVGPLVGWLLWRWRRARGERLPTGWASHPRPRDPSVARPLHVLRHAAARAPFSRHRFSLDAVSIIDPVYSLVLVLPLLVGWRRGWTSRRHDGPPVLALSSEHRLSRPRVRPRRQGPRIARGRSSLGSRVPVRVEAHPTVLQPWLRRLVVQTENGVGHRLGVALDG